MTLRRRSRSLMRGGLWSLLAALTILLVLACGGSSTPGGSASAALSPSADQSTRTTTQTFTTPVGPGGALPTCSAAQVADRLPPIVYRPPGLARTAKVPLLIALHGSQSRPQNMQGLSHFEQLAKSDGFVVAFPGSCDDTHPWGPTQDLTYLSSLIPQLIGSQNIDPTRVYVAGYSAGGYATWLLGCMLSREVTAVAIVSGAMNGRLYDVCSPSRPVSELLLVGTQDGTQYTGVPGRLPSPFQTTAHWRGLDGCAAQPVAATLPLPAVSQQVWSDCTDGSAVSLIIVKGAKHVWPPYGPGAPPSYSASAAVWAFLSAHTGAPLTLTGSDARVLSLRAAAIGGGRVRFTAKLHVAEPLTVVASLASGSSPRAVHLAAPGQRNVTVSWTFVAARRSSYHLLLTLRDSYGRVRRVARSVSGGTGG